jgi:SpoVK/Ycf46/Vps4 family AAA+-type ATPase
MAQNDGNRPAMRMAAERLDRVRGGLRAAPFPVKVALVAIAAAGGLVLAAALGREAAVIYGAVAAWMVWKGRRSLVASFLVAMTGLAVIVSVASYTGLALLPLDLIPFAAMAAAHARPVARSFIPCRTVALVLVWSIPPAMLAWRVGGTHHQVISYAVGWLLALVLMTWRLARSWQGVRADNRQKARSAALAGPYGGPAGTAPAGRGGKAGGPGGRTGAGEPARTVRAAEGARGQVSAVGPNERAQSEVDLPEITPDQAIAELDALIGLEPVKQQIRQLKASVEAARRRALAGYQTDKPMQHFVFLGPPGTGKTSVARIIAKIYYAFGLLENPRVLEAQRADLVGEYLGATAIKTNEAIDSALGGVLFIDEAYSLVNEGEGHGDRFGNEAVQALLKRAEDDRENLIVILAGYERQMEDFLASNPGLNSRFAMRIKFGSYSPGEMVELAGAQLARRGESIGPEAARTLTRMMDDVGRRRLADELGNGRFVRSLLEKAGQARDVRVMADVGDPTAADLVRLDAVDLERAFGELTSRFRGYAEAPTLDAALAELDDLIGLDPVKRQVHEIAAQLQVAKLRNKQGLASQPPVRHFVFTGPPGTGKTTVARILGRIFAALGLLVRPEVVEAHRADLVGEHLGSTAIKTGKLIDSALGGVLFIDEAYSLYNPGYAGGDAYGAEAVATLLKRAEDDRDRLVIVLAGYPADMSRFLSSNPGLSSRFSVRISFPSYTPAELGQIARVIAEQAGDSFDPGSLDVLEGIFREACAASRIDQLGNGRFARSLFERACAARDLRVSDLGESASAADLTTITAADVASAVTELTGDAWPRAATEASRVQQADAPDRYPRP